MKRPSAALLAVLLCLAGCGKKGAILPPLARVPQAPEFLSLAQRGSHAVLEWANPTAYIDGRALPGLARVEIWGAETQAGAGSDLPSPAEFKRRAALLAVVRQTEFARVRNGTAGRFLFLVPLDPARLGGRTHVFSLRAVDSLRRMSAFSALKGLTPRPLPLPPSGLRAEVGPQAVTLSWTAALENIDGSPAAPPAGFRVWRAEAVGPFRLLNPASVKEASFQDREFEFGRNYRYVVRAVSSAEEPYDESDDSPPLAVAPKDVFPPDRPAGLTTLPGEDFISLIWNPGTERDLAGYRVWRREEGRGDFQEISPELLVEPAFIDRAVEKDKRYEYATSAEDKTGNRSPLSDSVTDSRRTAHP